MRKFTKQEIRDLYNRFFREEIDFSEMVDIMNERVSERVSEAKRIDAEEMEANAHLIAAAPDLLEALQALMDGVANLPPLTAIEGVLEKKYKQAEKAINKALGK